MKVAYITSEIYPFSKTGGLGDVSYSFPVNIKKMGVEIIVITPLYRGINPKEKLSKKVKIFVDSRWEEAEIYLDEVKGVKVYFLKNHVFDTDKFYEGDCGLRFGFFCYGVIETLKAIDFKPDVIHINDWQCGMLPVILKENYSNEPFFRDVKVLLTIHNLAYQGYFPRDILSRLGLGDHLFVPEKLEFYNQVNFLKAGILYSDFITTVSPTYAKEIQTPEGGWGLDGVLRQRKDRIVGILNGIDEEFWNPETDSFIFKNYSLKSLYLKEENKVELQKVAGFKEDKDTVVLGFVGRLTYQKGFELVAGVCNEISKFKAHLFILGKGEPYYENMIVEVAKKYPDKVFLSLEFNEALAHKIYAGADFLLMPSVYEPCGLTQMIALKYGTIPVARRVGGLNDSIRNFHTGILFDDFDKVSFFRAIITSFSLFYSQKDELEKMRENGMKEDFSWKNPCKSYLDVYSNL